MVQQRQNWREQQAELAWEHLVFLDESAVKTNMTRLYGRAYEGERCFDHAPHGHWHTTSLIGAMRADGSSACMLLEGAMDAYAFRAYVKEILLPTLHHGDIVIADNLSTHKDVQAQQMIESVGAKIVFLPPYSPDFNPIEKMWSKIKAFLCAFKARTQQALEQAVAQALQTISAEDAKNWLDMCGYRTFH